MRNVISIQGQSKVPVKDVTKKLSKILIETFGEIPEGYEVESKITSFVAGLFLTHRGYAWISQDGPDDPIMLEDRWPDASTFDEVTVLAEKMIQSDSKSISEDETESMRHAAKLAERARVAAEKERLEREEKERLAKAALSNNPEDWLVE